jgi:hypothetical protein
VEQIQDPFLLVTPAYLLNPRVEVVVPSFSALLSNSARKMLCYLSPLLRTILLNEVEDESILLFGPRALDKARVQNLLPSMQALDISSSIQGLSNFLPILTSVSFDCFSEHIVFLFGPVAFGVRTLIGS